MPASEKQRHRFRGLFKALLITGLVSAFLPGSYAPAWSSQGQAVRKGIEPVRLKAMYKNLPLHFEANQGQTSSKVRFIARGPGYNLFLTPNEAVLVMSRIDGRGREKTASLRIQLLGADPLPETAGLGALPGKINYLTGSDRSRWRTNLPTFTKVRYKDVYPGIDLVFYGSQRRLEYDFVVGPGADPGLIRLAFKGADKIWINEKGDLIAPLCGSRLVQHAPVVYQEKDGRRRRISGRYTLTGRNQVGFKVAGYDQSRPLVIDPVLVYSTFLGGTASERIRSVAVDSTGAAYVAGFTLSTDFPTMNPYQGNQGGRDAFISKFNADGSALVYSTYLGGAGEDLAYGLALDSSKNAFVTGYTQSVDFPTLNAAQPGIASSRDAVVTKLNPSGSALVFSTYHGGDDHDEGKAIAVDSSGNAYVTGYTDSSDFPTVNSYQGDQNGRDAFVTKFNSAGARVYSTYLGAWSTDEAWGIAVDSAGSAYVTGQTKSNDFPTVNPYDGAKLSNGVTYEAFVAKFNAAGSALVYSTYLGGDGDGDHDTGYGIAVDSTGRAFVTGATDSADFPTTAGAFQRVYGGSMDAFVTKLHSSGSSLIYSGFLGDTGADYGYAIAVYEDGGGVYAHVTGRTGSLNFPTADAFQGSRASAIDAFVTKLNDTGGDLIYSSFLGGTDDEFGYSVALDSSGNAYVGGQTNSASFPTVNPYSGWSGGSMDAFLTKIENDLDTTAPAVDSTSPADGASDVPVDTTVSATFSEPMNEATIDDRTFILESAGGEVSGTVTYNQTNNTASFSPDADLEPDTEYMATIDGDVEDNNSVAMGPDYTWSFTTAGGGGSPAETETETRVVTLLPMTNAAGYRLVSVPLQPEATTSAAVFGSQIGTYDPGLMRIGRWDPNAQAYAEYPFSGPIGPGWAGWFLFRHGLNLTFQGTQTPSVQGPLGLEGYACTLAQGWNQVGNPFNYAVRVSDFMVQDGEGNHFYLAEASNTLTQRVFWVYSAGDYLSGTVLEAAQGGWIKSLALGEVQLFFQAVEAGRSGAGAAPVPAPDDLDRPPAPPGGFDSSAGSSGGGGGGGCFIGAVR